MGVFGNGSNNGAGVPDFSEYDFRSPLQVKEGFITLAEHQGALYRGVAEVHRIVKRSTEESAEREGQLLSAISRVENQMKIAIATSEATAARVGRLEVQRSPGSPFELENLRAEVAEIRKRTADDDRQHAVALAKQEAHLDELRRRFVTVEDDLTETGQRYVTDILKRAEDAKQRAIAIEASNAAAEAARRASQGDLDAKIEAERRQASMEIAKEGRENKRHWARWVAGGLLAVGMMVLSWLLGQHNGKVQAPTPPGVSTAK